MEPPPLDEALQYCLENPDNLSDDQLLGKFPQYRAELEPLLALDRQLKRALPSHMPAASKAVVRERLMDRAAARHAANRTGTATTQKPAVRQLGTPGAPSTPRWRSWLIGSAAVAAALILLWWAATRSLPGNPLYPVKLGTENILLDLSGSPSALIRGHLNLSDVRLVDVRTMQTRDALSQAGPAVENYYYHIRSCQSLWQARQDDKDLDLAKLLYASSVAGQRVLSVFGEGTENSAPAGIRSEVRESLTAVGSLQSSSGGVLRSAGLDLDQVLQESKGTVADLLAPIPGTGTPSPTPSAIPTSATPTPPGGAAVQGSSTAGIPAIPTLTAVLYAAQTTIAGAGSSNEAGVAAAETVVAWETGTPISTPILNAVQTVLAQPTFVVSVEPRVTGTPIPIVTLAATPQRTLTPLPSITPTLSLPPSLTSIPSTTTIPVPTPPAVLGITSTNVVPLPGSANAATLTPGAIVPTEVKVPTPEISLPPLPPKIPQP